MSAHQSWLVVATWETEHFSFMACGGNYNTVKKYVEETWRKHLEDYRKDGAGLTTFKELDDFYGVNLTRVFAGYGGRDGSQILP